MFWDKITGWVLVSAYGDIERIFIFSMIDKVNGVGLKVLGKLGMKGSNIGFMGHGTTYYLNLNFEECWKSRIFNRHIKIRKDGYKDGSNI